MSKTKQMTTITAGRFVRVVAYSRSMPYDSTQARQAKARFSSQARQATNFRTAWENAQMLLLTNFDPAVVGSVHMVLTYDDAHVPKNRRSAKRYAQGFFDRLRSTCRMQGEPCLYLYNTEEHTSGGDGCRIHHHVVLWCGKLTRDYDLLRSLWLAGSNVEIRPLGMDKRYSEDMRELAKYLCKERSPDIKDGAVGDKVCVGSRTLRRPVKHSELVEETLTLMEPPGTVRVERSSASNSFGTFDRLDYLTPAKK